MMESFTGGALPVAKSPMDKKQQKTARHQLLFSVCLLLAALFLCGCSHLGKGGDARATFNEANDFFNQGNYLASLGKYQLIIEKYPEAGDRALFETGLIYAHPANGQRDYQKAVESFQKVVKEYPESLYRKDSELMLFNIDNVILKDRTIAAQQTIIEALQEEIKGRDNEIAVMQKSLGSRDQEIRARENEISALQKEIFSLQKGPADRVLIEKRERRLTLFAKGKVLKTYKIALGGDPVGPKERQGDNKTPEGIYLIESRNRDSRFHLSLRISYPNEKDKKRAKQLGVSPGGDIMIHGIKNGLSWVGDRHAEIDWTQGCIAVTDEEIEEIERLVPNGTIVEIRAGGQDGA